MHEIATWLTPAEVAAILKTTPGHLANLRWAGRGPAFLKVEGSKVIYTAKAVAEWQQEQMRASGVAA